MQCSQDAVRIYEEACVCMYCTIWACFCVCTYVHACACATDTHAHSDCGCCGDGWQMPILVPVSTSEALLLVATSTNNARHRPTYVVKRILRTCVGVCSHALDQEHTQEQLMNQDYHNLCHKTKWQLSSVNYPNTWQQTQTTYLLQLYYKLLMTHIHTYVRTYICTQWSKDRNLNQEAVRETHLQGHTVGIYVHTCVRMHVHSYCTSWEAQRHKWICYTVLTYVRTYPQMYVCV